MPTLKRKSPTIQDPSSQPKANKRQTFVAQPPVEGPVKKQRALVVGINRYMDQRIPPLFGCVRDAINVAATLEMLNFEVTILLNENATRAKILDAINGLEAESSLDNGLLIDLKGHGSNQGDFLCYDAISPAAHIFDIGMGASGAGDPVNTGASLSQAGSRNAFLKEGAVEFLPLAEEKNHEVKATEGKISVFELLNKTIARKLRNPISAQDTIILDACVLKGPASRIPVASTTAIQSQYLSARNFPIGHLNDLCSQYKVDFLLSADEGQRALEVRRKDERVMGLFTTTYYQELLWRLPLAKINHGISPQLETKIIHQLHPAELEYYKLETTGVHPLEGREIVVQQLMNNGFTVKAEAEAFLNYYVPKSTASPISRVELSLIQTKPHLEVYYSRLKEDGLTPQEASKMVVQLAMENFKMYQIEVKENEVEKLLNELIFKLTLTCPGCPRCGGCARCDVDLDVRISAARSPHIPIAPLEPKVLHAIVARCRQSTDRLSAHVQQPILLPWNKKPSVPSYAQSSVSSFWQPAPVDSSNDEAGEVKIEIQSTFR